VEALVALSFRAVGFYFQFAVQFVQAFAHGGQTDAGSSVRSGRPYAQSRINGPQTIPSNSNSRPVARALRDRDRS
jgi:hypothetical protein